MAVPQPERDTEVVELDSNSVYEVVSGTTTSTSSSNTIARPSGGDNIQVIESPQLGSLPPSPEALRNLTTAAPETKRTTTMQKQRPSENSTPTVGAKAAANANATIGGTSTTIALLPRRNATKSTYTALSSDKLRRPQTPSSSTTSTSTTSTTPAPVSTTSKPGVLREGGQLFQDAMKQEPMTVTSNMRGV